MPFYKAIKSNSFVGFKRKGGLLDPDFFAGPVDNLWGWGTNDGGSNENKLIIIATGYGLTRFSSPIQTSFTTHKFKTISLGSSESNFFGIKPNSPDDGGGTLWAFGTNGNSQLGFGDSDARTSPVQVGARTDYKKVTQGGNGYAHFLLTDGTLLACGYNLTWTMLGDGTNTSRSSPVQIGTGYFDVANSDNNTIASKSDGTIWSWGINGTQQGDNSTFNFTGTFNDPAASRNTPNQIGSGGYNSVMASNYVGHGAAKSDGYLWGWGSVFGTFTTTPTQRTAYGTGWSNCNFGSSGQGKTASVGAIIKSDGTLWMFGSNSVGQLGQGDTTSYSSPKQVGTNNNWFDFTVLIDSVFATTTDRRMFSWGRNTDGVLCLGDTNNRSSPTQIGTKKRWGKIASKGSTYSGASTTVLALSAVVT